LATSHDRAIAEVALRKAAAAVGARIGIGPGGPVVVLLESGRRRKACRRRKLR
jgi:hypothetical protein